MNKNKRIFALISAAIMLSFAGVCTSCKSSVDSEAEQTEQNARNQETEVMIGQSGNEGTREIVNNIDETVIGHIDGNVYTNEVLGFSFDGKDDFKLTGYEAFMADLADNIEISDYLMKNGMAVILSAESKGVNFQISVMSDEMREMVFVDEARCQEFLDILDSSDNMKNSEAVQLNFVGQKIWAGHIVYNEENGIQGFYQSYFFMNDKVVSLTIDIYSGAPDINAICSLFTKI